MISVREAKNSILPSRTSVSRTTISAIDYPVWLVTVCMLVHILLKVRLSENCIFSHLPVNLAVISRRWKTNQLSLVFIFLFYVVLQTNTFLCNIFFLILNFTFYRPSPSGHSPPTCPILR